MNSPAPNDQPSGLPEAIGAYLIWSMLPLYLLLVQSVPPFEFVGWRIIWTLPVCLIFIAIRRQFPALREALASPQRMVLLALSALLIGINWFVYVWAIQRGNVYAASLGYYLNPLVNVLLATVFLKERLSRLQWLAVTIATVAVALLLGGALTTLWISVTLAVSFALYGLVRKHVAVGSLPGLTIESAILLPLAVAIAAWYAASPAGSSFGHDLWLSLAIMLGGVVTAVPLLLFAIAARRMDYSTIGFLQYITPTLVFVLGLTVFREELRPVQLGSFVLIWIAIAIFVWDLLMRRRAAAIAAA
ncbi:MAG: EamA family transporter RarD [Erythrobacter sp.]